MTDTSPVIFTSSPSRKTPKRGNARSPLQEKRSKSQIRTPLKEKSSSETNEGAGRRGKERLADSDIFSTTPFPTKPQHVLLPSTIRKQKSFQHAGTIFAGYQPDATQDNESSRGTKKEGSASRKAPIVQLKKSVTTLRDMYEAQEKSSRPSTAASALGRPTTSSSRLRSASSSDGTSGRYAWERLHQISSDDMALLPSLNQTMLKQMDSEQSFASRMTRTQPLTSSPNFQIYASSSPKMSVYRDEPSLQSEFTRPSSALEMTEVGTSSPNFVRLGRSSSVGGTDDYMESYSSPNVIKLGTSSPVQQGRTSPTPSSRSTGSLKRKRSDTFGKTSYPPRSRPLDSSPPYIIHAASSSQPSIQSTGSGPVPSSPPEHLSVHSLTTSSPVFRLPAVSHTRSDSSSSSSVHASLQAALSSSPMPPIQYPVVRAPSAVAQSLTVPKRNRSAPVDAIPFSTRLSPVPSEWDETSSVRILEEYEGDFPHAMSSQLDVSRNDSQIHIIAEDDHPEAGDELSALPRTYRPPTLVPVRNNSIYGALSSTLSTSSATQSQSRLNSLRHSMDSRLNSMRSYTHSRRGSTMSNNMRPTSSSSVTTNVIVPTWARRYYSGFYHDSFQYLYPSQSNSAAHLSAPLPHQNYLLSNTYQANVSLRASTRTSRSSWHSFQSIRDSLRSSVLDRLPNKLRPRLEARKSHLTAGIGPLVSNPVRPESAVLQVEPMTQRTSTIRHISVASLSPVDPRAHWANQPGSYIISTVPYDQAQQYGHLDEIQHAQYRGNQGAENYHDASHSSTSMQSRFRFPPSPHLHHDRRLNTGSSVSRGYGFPFNRKSRYGAPSVYGMDGETSWSCMDLRSTQKIAFIVGFLFPISWFVASFLPLPTRPAKYTDIEKAEWNAATHNGQRPLGDYEELDVLARLRMERHTKGLEENRWQNANWWRRMNRVMSIVGIVVVILVIVLAVVGVMNKWGT